MNVENYVREIIRDRNPVVYGIGNNSLVGECFLNDLGITEWMYCSSDYETVPLYKGVRVMNPDELGSENYVIVSLAHISEVKPFLEKKGLRDPDDWLWVLDIPYYEGLLSNKAAPHVRNLSFNDLDEIEYELRRVVRVERIGGPDEQSYSEFENSMDFLNIYEKNTNPRYRRKVLEYYYAYNLLELENNNKVYLDIGACESGFAKWLREHTQTISYAVDICEGPYSDLDYYLCCDATKMPFDDNSVDAVSIQSAFEMFSEDGDINAVREFARVLKPGGKAVILPLYLHRDYLSTVSPNYYGMGNADEGSLECIRTDCWSWVPMARFYDVAVLEKRVLNVARIVGLTAKVLSIRNEDVEKDGFVYLKFVLLLEKLCND